MPIKFGTDGWRAVISDEFTFANVRLVSQAVAEKALADFKEKQQFPNGNKGTDLRPSMVVGYDTRFLSDRYAQAVAEVLAGNGIKVWLAKSDAPTPVVSFAIVHQKADGGIMITASHNPPRYTGIKLKAAYGGSTSEGDVKKVEERVHALESAGAVPAVLERKLAEAQGLIVPFDPLTGHEVHLSTLIDFDVISSSWLEGGCGSHVRRGWKAVAPA